MARGPDTILETESDSSSDESDTTAPAPAPAARTPPAQEDRAAMASGAEHGGGGIVNVTEAVGLGSDVAAYILGEAFFKGKFGLPKDPAQARFWLKKVADGECKIKHLNSRWIANSAEMLRELDEQASELEE